MKPFSALVKGATMIHFNSSPYKVFRDIVLTGFLESITYYAVANT
jgi:hypothetical protein